MGPIIQYITYKDGLLPPVEWGNMGNEALIIKMMRMGQIMDGFPLSFLLQCFAWLTFYLLSKKGTGAANRHMGKEGNRKEKTFGQKRKYHRSTGQKAMKRKGRNVIHPYLKAKNVQTIMNCQ
jgi:hypothetical protein